MLVVVMRQALMHGGMRHQHWHRCAALLRHRLARLNLLEKIFECFLKIKFGPFWEAGCTFLVVHSCISQLVSELQSGQEPENELNTAP